MTNTDDVADTSAEPGELDRPKRRGWLGRKSIRALRREVGERHAVWGDWDQRDNEYSRLPGTEDVHLGGLVLVEAFPPSRAAALYKALNDFPTERKKKDEWIAQLSKGRSAAGHGGWTSLGAVRRPGGWSLGDNMADPDLPDGVDAAWPYLFFPTPSLTMIVVTFTLTDDAGDLSGLLRDDYHSAAVDVRIHVRGRFGSARAHIPWARPASHGWSFSLLRAEDQKRNACESLMAKHEADCWAWLAARFPGRFGAEQLADRPKIRIVLTTEEVPFADRRPWLAPAGLGFASQVWRSSEAQGWAFRFDNWPRARRFVATAAARTSDAIGDKGADAGGETTWYLTQKFAHIQSPLVARWGMSCLLSVYADQLARFRDRAVRPRRMARPVGQARDLDRYLIGDGLDASTVVSDLALFTENLARFRWGAPEYSEDLSGYPEHVRPKREPDELIPVLREGLQHDADRLARDTEVTTGNIRASAELRQAIANTQLQRRILALTILAIVIAVISLAVAV